MKNLWKLAAVVMLISTGCTKELPKRPNILFITTDYMAWEDIPALTPVLQMPTLDKLCKEGLVFENHYCTAPVCMPSRYTIVSGTYPHTHGRWDNGGGWLPEGSPVLMEELQKAGYQTVGIGKMHFSPWSRMAGFDKRIIADCQGNGAADTLKQDDYYWYLRKAGKTRFDFLRYQDSTDLFGVYDWPLNDTLDIDYYVGEQTVRYVKGGNLKGPWFMWVSFDGPHNPWDPPAEYSQYYLDRDLPTARYTPGELEHKPYEQTISRFNYTRKVVDRIDQYPEKRDEYIKRIRAGHYGGLTWIDEQLKKIIDQMQSQGLLDNTLIVFSADHGAHLGDHDNIHKGTLYERSAHVPFIMWWPGALKPGKFEGFSGHIDLLPTFIELAGGTVPAAAEGRSLVPVLEKKEKPDDHEIIEIKGNTAIVTKDYKFGLYRQYQEGDLYDRKNDAWEMNNLYYDSTRADLVNELTEELFNADPTLEKAFKAAPLPSPLPVEVEMKYGDVIRAGEGPYLNSKSFKLDVDLDIKAGDSGPVITNYEGPHGFSLYLMNGIVYMGFKTWNETEVFPVIKNVKPGNIRFTCILGKDGTLKVMSDDGTVLSESMTKWPKPYQDGRHEYLTGTYTAGLYGSGRRIPPPIGDYERGKDFTGKINLLKLTVLD